jgi:hypothetical protein
VVRCKACGYITKEGKLGDRCPACGAPRTAFEPYTDPMSPRRRAVLNLQLHPVATHFPVSFVTAALVFTIAASLIPGGGHEMLVSTTKILTLLLPFLVIATFWLGWWDGRVRFRKIRNSRILKMKILYAGLLFIITVGLGLVVWTGELGTAGYIWGALLLGAAGFVLVILLGLLGSSILGAAFPGK